MHYYHHEKIIKTREKTKRENRRLFKNYLEHEKSIFRLQKTRKQQKMMHNNFDNEDDFYPITIIHPEPSQIKSKYTPSIVNDEFPNVATHYVLKSIWHGFRFIIYPVYDSNLKFNEVLCFIKWFYLHITPTFDGILSQLHEKSTPREIKKAVLYINNTFFGNSADAFKKLKDSFEWVEKHHKNVLPEFKDMVNYHLPKHLFQKEDATNDQRQNS